MKRIKMLWAALCAMLTVALSGVTAYADLIIPGQPRQPSPTPDPTPAVPDPAPIAPDPAPVTPDFASMTMPDAAMKPAFSAGNSPSADAVG